MVSIDEDDFNLLESQFIGLLEGDGSSEDHMDCKAIFMAHGFSNETIDRIWFRLFPES